MNNILPSKTQLPKAPRRIRRGVPLVWLLTICTVLIVSLVLGAFTLIQSRLETARNIRDHQLLFGELLPSLIVDIESATDLGAVREQFAMFQQASLQRGHLDLRVELKDGTGKLLASSSKEQRYFPNRTLNQNIPILSSLLPSGYGSLLVWQDNAALSAETNQRWRFLLMDVALTIACILAAMFLANFFLVNRPVRRLLGQLRLMRNGYNSRFESIGGAMEWRLLAQNIQQLGEELEETVRRLVEAERQAQAPDPATPNQNRPDLVVGQTPDQDPAAAPAASKSNGKNIRHSFVRLYLQNKCKMLEGQDPRDPSVLAIAKEVWEKDVGEAERINAMGLRTRLDNGAFRILYPQEHDRIRSFVEKMTQSHSQWIQQRERELRQALAKHHVPCVSIQSRVKHTAGIFRKMQATGLSLEQLGDIFAFRVIVLEVAHCYQALTAIHQRFEPQLLRFKDYIANPKPNGYQSLHTSVRDESGLGFEVQIRTPNMQQQADGGAAAHWRYKQEQHEWQAATSQGQGFWSKLQRSLGRSPRS